MGLEKKNRGEVIENDKEKCSDCKFFLRLLDLQKYDGMLCDDMRMKVTCAYDRKKCKDIASSLSPDRVKNIASPDWCPKNQEKE